MDKNIKRVLFAVISLFATVNLAQAEEVEPDKFRFAIGGYAIARYDSTISVTDPGLGAGISIDPQNTFGLDFEGTVLRIEGYYRFRPKHALTYSWYSINSTGSKIIDEEIGWDGPDGEIIIPIGAQVISNFDYDIFKVGYLWSFYHTDKVELGVGAGLHITRLRLGLDASVTNPPNQSLQNVNTTVPLPVVSLVLNYSVTPKFHWYLKTEAFVVKFDNWTGSYRDATLGMEYRAWRHVALGAGLSSNSLEIEEDDPNYQLRFDNTISGALLYVATYF
ncbi:MAG: hypothetical protein DRQ59_04485 [Gammaproteobacteria bacterium]|nr:MAG: hypothetical protein DRQ59_04485 [Gammaproteobacteria bacterium]